MKKKLGSIVTDTVTGLSGMITHRQTEIGGNVYVHFQPRVLNPETGHPVDGVWIHESRLEGGKEVEPAKIPLEVLGTWVTDKATGFCGKAFYITEHISGCVHIGVQPTRILEKTGNVVEAREFDIRRLKGGAIPILTEEEIDISQEKNPSPAPVAHGPGPRKLQHY